MDNLQQIRHGRHCVFQLHAHLVFVTKYRRGVLTHVMLEDLRGIFEVVCGKFGAELVECKGEDDHVHLLVAYPPKVALSTLVNSLKGVSSRLLRKAHGRELEKRLWQNQLWSPSYYAGSVGGAPLSVVARYIEQQRAPTA